MGRLRRGCLFAVPGVCLWVGGFLYDALFVGIPYQDPPPALQADYERRSELAGTIEHVGLGVAVLGVVVGVARRSKARDT